MTLGSSPSRSGPRRRRAGAPAGKLTHELDVSKTYMKSLRFRLKDSKDCYRHPGNFLPGDGSESLIVP